MSTRTVRLNAESERALAEVRRAEASTHAWAVYETLDLGPGGYAKAPARDPKRALRRSLVRQEK
jgi:hypothetical protein